MSATGEPWPDLGDLAIAERGEALARRVIARTEASGEPQPVVCYAYALCLFVSFARLACDAGDEPEEAALAVLGLADEIAGQAKALAEQIRGRDDGAPRGDG